MTGRKPYEGLDGDMIESLFREEKFPETDGLILGNVMVGCCKQQFHSAKDILQCADSALFKAKARGIASP